MVARTDILIVSYEQIATSVEPADRPLNDTKSHSLLMYSFVPRKCISGTYQQRCPSQSQDTV